MVYKEDVYPTTKKAEKKSELLLSYWKMKKQWYFLLFQHDEDTIRKDKKEKPCPPFTVNTGSMPSLQNNEPDHHQKQIPWSHHTTASLLAPTLEKDKSGLSGLLLARLFSGMENTYQRTILSIVVVAYHRSPVRTIGQGQGKGIANRQSRGQRAWTKILGLGMGEGLEWIKCALKPRK